MQVIFTSVSTLFGKLKTLSYLYMVELPFEKCSPGWKTIVIGAEVPPNGRRQGSHFWQLIGHCGKQGPGQGVGGFG